MGLDESHLKDQLPKYISISTTEDDFFYKTALIQSGVCSDVDFSAINASKLTYFPITLVPNKNNTLCILNSDKSGNWRTTPISSNTVYLDTKEPLLKFKSNYYASVAKKIAGIPGQCNPPTLGADATTTTLTCPSGSFSSYQAVVSFDRKKVWIISSAGMDNSLLAELDEATDKTYFAISEDDTIGQKAEIWVATDAGFTKLNIDGLVLRKVSQRSLKLAFTPLGLTVLDTNKKRVIYTEVIH